MANNIFEKFGKDPLALFGKWLAEAEKSELNDPNAMALATADENARPSVRMVLMKGFDDRGFMFFTNLDSEKGNDLQKNSYAEANFHWKSLEKQIRIAGPVERTTDKEADDYFASRSRESRIGACASSQSAHLESYEDFEKKVKELEKKFQDKDVPRPAHWGGFRIKPERMEFWIGHPHRLHQRFIYIKNGKDWNATWLFP